MSKARLSIIPAKAIADPALNATALRVLCALGTYTDDNGWCFPKQSSLADDLGIGRAAVNRAVQILKAQGYVEVYEQRRRDGGRGANSYRVILDPKAPPQLDLPLAAEPDLPPPVSPESHTPCIAGDTGPDSPGDTGPVSAAESSLTTQLNDPNKILGPTQKNGTGGEAPPALERLLQAMRRELGDGTWASWIAPLRIVALDPPILEAPSRFHAEHIRQHFSERIEQRLGKAIKVQFPDTGARRAPPHTARPIPANSGDAT